MTFSHLRGLIFLEIVLLFLPHSKVLCSVKHVTDLSFPGEKRLTRSSTLVSSCYIQTIRCLKVRRPTNQSYPI